MSNITEPADKVIDELEEIEVTVTYRDEEYKIQAFQNKDNPDEYILSHSSLLKTFLEVARKYDGEINMQSVDVETSLNHCITKVCITSPEHQAPIWFKGEAVTSSLDKETRNTPSRIAENRAFDLAVIEFFGLDSKRRSRDGKPILNYSDNILSQPSSSSGTTTRKSKAPLSAEEIAEFASLSAYIVPRKDANGDWSSETLASIDSEKLTQWANMDLSQNPAQKEKFSGVQEKIKRYLALKERVNNEIG